MDWEEIGKWLFAVVSLGVLALIGAFTIITKNVDYYYLSKGSEGRSASSCVYAHWTWHSDEVAFCTDDYNRALEFAAKANAGLHAK